jgi:hypothetical protein
MIPPSVTSIGRSAFRGCVSLTEVMIPRACNVANYAFDGCLRVQIVRV